LVAFFAQPTRPRIIRRKPSGARGGPTEQHVLQQKVGRGRRTPRAREPPFNHVPRGTPVQEDEFAHGDGGAGAPWMDEPALPFGEQLRRSDGRQNHAMSGRMEGGTMRFAGANGLFVRRTMSRSGGRRRGELFRSGLGVGGLMAAPTGISERTPMMRLKGSLSEADCPIPPPAAMGPGDASWLFGTGRMIAPKVIDKTIVFLDKQIPNGIGSAHKGGGARVEPPGGHQAVGVRRAVENESQA